MPRVTTYNVHATDVQRFRTCRQQWQWASPMRQNLAPRETYAPFFVGSLVHSGLEQWYKARTLPAQALPFYLAEQGQTVPDEGTKLHEYYTDALGYLDHYLLWAKSDKSVNADMHLDHVATEYKFKYLLHQNSRKRVYLRGMYDGIVQHRNTGLYYLHEIKTTRSINERLRQTELDTQTDTYLLTADRVVSELLGKQVQVAGVMYTLIRKKLPATPEELKNGNLSVKKISTSPYHYAACVKKHHDALGTPRSVLAELYGSYIQDLLVAEAADPFFARHVVHRTTNELTTAMQDLQATVAEMINPNLAIYPNPNDRCGYCLFRNPCVARQHRTSDEAMLTILSGNYVQNDRYADERSE